MSEDKTLDALFQLLKEMTSPPKDVLPRAVRIMRWVENTILIVVVAAMLVLIAIVTFHRFDASAPSPGITLAIIIPAAMILVFAPLYSIVVIAGEVATAWRQRHEHFPVLFAALQKNLQTDAIFLTRLWRFDKPTLEYGLIQYRHYWSIPDRRVGSLVGDIRKIGLLPALAAAMVSATTLLKAESHFYLWLPLAVTCAFYLIGFFAVNQRERPDKVIGLLEYAIHHADDPPVLVRTDAAPVKPVNEPSTPANTAPPIPA